MTRAKYLAAGLALAVLLIVGAGVSFAYGQMGLTMGDQGMGSMMMGDGQMRSMMKSQGMSGGHMMGSFDEDQPFDLQFIDQMTMHHEGAMLSDPNLAVSKTYDANKYGMMGGSHNGHTFIVVGPDGEIKWRADYGGAPDYTMYVPVPDLLADMREGLEGGSS